MWCLCPTSLATTRIECSATHRRSKWWPGAAGVSIPHHSARPTRCDGVRCDCVCCHGKRFQPIPKFPQIDIPKRRPSTRALQNRCVQRICLYQRKKIFTVSWWCGVLCNRHDWADANDILLLQNYKSKIRIWIVQTFAQSTMNASNWKCKSCLGRSGASACWYFCYAPEIKQKRYKKSSHQ